MKSSPAGKTAKRRSVTCTMKARRATAWLWALAFNSQSPSLRQSACNASVCCCFLNQSSKSTLFLSPPEFTVQIRGRYLGRIAG